MTTKLRLAALRLAFLSSAALAGARALAQTPCQGSTGPDVIVGDMTGPANYASNAGLEALSLGTVSCNQGSQPLRWFSATADHPVIGGNLYRYKVVGGAGRFEQVGLSWLKHGFVTFNETLCCPTCSPTDGSWLGVGCSDPYSSAQNGAQAGLGPRHQVNAHTGVFAYPPANPAYTGSTARRIEVALADLEATGASTTRYFGEAHYVAPDDAAAGNQNNNSSWREITVTGSSTTWNFAYGGATTREQPALHAWKAIDPAVKLESVQVSGEGRFLLASRATSLGGGVWRYEYAVHNQNSDRAGGGFREPIAPGIQVTNVGFHDVAYRNGDGAGNVNQSGLDWASAAGGGELAWVCEANTNALANALRWGTTYNFRFDADAAPANGLVKLDLWKSGSPALVTATLDVPGGAPTSFAACFGDGSGSACPCANPSSVGAAAGCLHSLGTGGALVASGVASLSNDTLVLAGASMPNSSALYFQGTSLVNAGAGSAFGDGLRCAGGSVIRLGTKANVAGASQYPAAGDVAISIKGVASLAAMRVYQIWFRNAASFCNPETFNLSNGWQVTWGP